MPLNPARVAGASSAMAMLMLWALPGLADTPFPLSAFQGLSATELATVQGKVADVGTRLPSAYTLAFAVGTLDLGVFRPFYQTGYETRYSTDTMQPRTFAVTSEEAAALVDSLEAIASVADGGVDGKLSFALFAIKGGVPVVFETMVDTTGARLLFRAFLEAFASNPAAVERVESFACPRGLLPGPAATEVTDQVAITQRGFRKKRSTGEFVGRMRITNMGSQSLAAPVFVAFRPPEGVTLLSGNGFTCAVKPTGAPYQVALASGTLGPGQHLDLVLRFDNPDEDPLDLIGQRVYAGPGFR